MQWRADQIVRNQLLTRPGRRVLARQNQAGVLLLVTVLHVSAQLHAVVRRVDMAVKVVVVCRRRQTVVGRRRVIVVVGLRLRVVVVVGRRRYVHASRCRRVGESRRRHTTDGRRATALQDHHVVGRHVVVGRLHRVVVVGQRPEIVVVVGRRHRVVVVGRRYRVVVVGRRHRTVVGRRYNVVDTGRCLDVISRLRRPSVVGRTLSLRLLQALRRRRRLRPVVGRIQLPREGIQQQCCHLHQLLLQC